jgi:hypothetical protein
MLAERNPKQQSVRLLEWIHTPLKRYFQQAPKGVSFTENRTYLVFPLQTKILPKRIGQQSPQFDCPRFG